MIEIQRRQHQVQSDSPENPPPTSSPSIPDPTPSNNEPVHMVIIQDQTNSNNFILSYYTAANDEPRTWNNPIDVDQLFQQSDTPHIAVGVLPRVHLAPVTIPCTMCRYPRHNVYGMALLSASTVKRLGIQDIIVTSWDSILFNSILNFNFVWHVGNLVILQIDAICYQLINQWRWCYMDQV